LSQKNVERIVFFSKEQYMNLIVRAKNMILTPKMEWAIIANEVPNSDGIFRRYVFPMTFASAAAVFIGHMLILGGGINDTEAKWAFYFGIQTIFIGTLGIWLTAIVLSALAKNFKSEISLSRSIQLVAYSMTPAWVGGLVMIYPPVGIIGLLFGFYGLYLLYLGLPYMMKTTEVKTISFRVIPSFILLVICIVLGLIYRIIVWYVITSFLKNLLINSHPLK
jgi:hypothetical protein